MRPGALDFDPEDALAIVDATFAMASPTVENQPRRSPSQVHLVKQRIAWLAESWTRRGDLKVLPGDWWECGFKEGGRLAKVIEEFILGTRTTLDDIPDDVFRAEQILYPEAALYEELDDEIDGKIDHECGHALHTDFRGWFRVQRIAKDQGYLPTSAASGLNAIEDPRINNLQVGISEHRLRQFRAVYSGWLAHNNVTIHEQPPSSAVGTLLIAKWIQERLTILDQDGFDALYNQSHPDARTYFDRLIGDSRVFWNTVDGATAIKLYETRIWPVYRELEQKSVEDQMRKITQETPNGTSDDPSVEEAKDGVREEMIEAIIRSMTEDKLDALKEQARKALDRAQAECLNEERMPGGITMEENPKTGNFEAKVGTIQDDEAKAAQDKVGAIIDEMKGGEARKNELLKAISDAKTLAEIDGILRNEDEFPSAHANEISRAANAKHELLHQQRSQKIKQMKRYGFMNDDEEEPSRSDERLFDRLKAAENAVKPHVKKFVDSILHEIPMKETVIDSERRVRAGTDLDPEILGDFGARAQGAIFKAVETAEERDPRIFITFMIDRSGSMDGRKMEESLKTLIFFALCLRDIGERTGRPVDFSIIFFNDDVSEAKRFNDDYESPSHKTWGDGKSMSVKKRIMTQAQPSGGTDMGAGVIHANRDLNKRKQQHPDYMSCLFAIGDGETFGKLRGESLRRFIKGLEEYQGEKMGRHLSMGFFLRGGTNEGDPDETTPMEKYFGKRGEGTIVVDDFDQMVPEASKALKKVLRRMAKRLFGT